MFGRTRTWLEGIARVVSASERDDAQLSTEDHSTGTELWTSRTSNPKVTVDLVLDVELPGRPQYRVELASRRPLNRSRPGTLPVRVHPDDPWRSTRPSNQEPLGHATG